MNHKIIKLVLAFALSFDCMLTGMQVSAEEEQYASRYVVLKKINEDIEDRDIAVTLLKIGENTTRSFYNGEQGIMFDTYLLREESDEVIGSLCRSVAYGDIVEYRGNNLMQESGSAYNSIYRIDRDAADSFEKVGSLFDAPTEDANIINVDGESVIEVTSAEGDTYLIYPGTPGDIRIELKHYQNLLEIGEKQDVLGDFNQDNVVNASDATFVLIYAAKHGAGTLTDNYEDVNNVLAPIAKDGVALAESYCDFNHDGEVNASDASIILIYAAEHGAGTFSGTFEEYVNR